MGKSFGEEAYKDRGRDYYSRIDYSSGPPTARGPWTQLDRPQLKATKLEPPQTEQKGVLSSG